MGEETSHPQADITSNPYGPDGQEISTPQEMYHAVENAAVRPETGAPSLSEEEKEKIDAALRARIPKPPLTDEDIAKLTAHRGKAPTQEEIDGMNRARELGIHTSIV